MIWEVVRKEIRANISSPKVVITYIVCAVLILTSMVAGAVNYLNLKEEARIQADGEKERLRNVSNFQDDFLNRGMRVFRKPSVLSVIVSGIEGDGAQRGTVNSFLNPMYDVSKFNSTPILAVFGLLDLGFIVKIILSLFVILFTFDAITGEKELGTLKLNFANDLKRSSFIIGKLIGNFILLILPFVIPLLLGLLILQFIPGVQFAGEDWVRVSLIVLAFLLYLLTFYSLGMMVSSVTKRSAVSFLVLLMLWVLFIGIVPRLSVLVAQNVKPVDPLDEVSKNYAAEFGPAQYEFISFINDEIKRLQREAAQRQPRPPMVPSGQAQAEYEEKVREFQNWVEGAREELMRSMSEKYDEFSKKMQERGQEIARQHDLKQEEQNSVAIGISRLASPAAALTFAVNRMGKTGVYSSDSVFRDNVEAQLKHFRAYADEKIKGNPNLLGYGRQTGMMDVSEVYPNLDLFEEESLGVSIRETLQDYAVLALLSIVFLAIAFVAFLRYDVR